MVLPSPSPPRWVARLASAYGLATAPRCTVSTVQEPLVVKLRWNPNDNSILAIAPDNGRTLVTVFSALPSNTKSYVVQDSDAIAELDAAWISETEFLLCGGDLLISLRCSDDGIVRGTEFDTRPDDSFGQVQFDWQTKLIATTQRHLRRLFRP